MQRANKSLAPDASAAEGAGVDKHLLVAQGYDALADRWAAWADEVVPSLREQHASVLIDRLAPGSRVLEIGCGPGIPIAAALDRVFEVTAVDISEAMIDRARVNVPGAHCLVADVVDLTFADGSFEGVAAFFSLIHVDRIHHAELFGRIFSWLTPGGLFVASLGAFDLESDIQDDWLGGGPMFWSFFDAEANVGLLRDAGFEIEAADVHTMIEQPDDQEVSFQWVTARRP